MKSIQSTGYSIYFSHDAYQQLNFYLSKNKVRTIFVLVDENTFIHCYSKFRKNIPQQITAEVIKIRAGELHKNIDTCVEVWEKLTELGADRKSILINLGGGMVTDLGGFVGSTFKRGIKFINVPTTILGMVDASVGSKTGVDLGHLKNLIGLFSNPEMVLIDVAYLETLSKREMRSGAAEIIKYGLTFDSDLLADIKNDNWFNTDNLNKIIYQSILIKNKVVLQDIKEENLRKVLNFGHTIGHAVESFYLEHKLLEDLTHGEAIAIGMIIEGYLSHKIFDFPLLELEGLKAYVHKVYGKIHLRKEDFEGILTLMKHDKKNTNGTINYVLLKNISEFVIDVNAPTDLVIEGIEYYNS